MELLIGCGSNREKKIAWKGKEKWTNLVTLDINPDHKPDVVWDLNDIPLPFDDNTADEIFAFEILEHLGKQGDFWFFFSQWADFWRILKPDGIFFGTVPHWQSVWAWADPSHTRVIPPESFTFLSQPEYAKQVGVTPMSDFRFIYKCDFDLIHLRTNEAQQTEFMLKAIKPSRISI
jgi:SAM-dependent methyltransferase